MRLASNQLKDILGFYNSELANVYEKSEIDAMAARAVAHYLGYSPTELITKARSNVNQSDLLKLYDCAKALKRHVPLQYILGETFFYGLRFKVDPQVLIPRPETEELVELVLEENSRAASFLDIGTGSGCIPVSIKKNLPASRVSACDISPGALQVARTNARLNQSEVDLFEADVLDLHSFPQKAGGPFEVIISNPPYIKPSEKNTLPENVVGHEPDLALFVEGGDDILFYRKIIDHCAVLLSAHGRLYFELNPLTAEAVLDYAMRSQLFGQAQLLKDLSGNTRFFKASRT